MMSRQALVVERKENARGLVPALILAGWQTELATTVSAAADRAASSRPDVVVLNMDVLGDKAAVLVTHLRLSCGRRLAILGISSSQPSEFLMDALALSGWLLVPVDPAVLVRAVNHSLKQGYACPRGPFRESHPWPACGAKGSSR
jgi:DNA-binding NarL/FixJ family response regulator